MRRLPRYTDRAAEGNVSDDARRELLAAIYTLGIVIGWGMR